MTAALSVIIGVLLMGGAALVIWFAIALFRAVFGGGSSAGAGSAGAGIPSGSTGGARSGEMTAEEEGNVHSGPYGYSPNTAYPETQYGSLFDPDAEWAHEEEM